MPKSSLQHETNIIGQMTVSMKQFSFKNQYQQIKKVYKTNYSEAVSIVITFAIQYSFFPGIMFVNEPTFFTNFSWFVISVVTFHSVLDTIGRYIGGRFPTLVPKDRYLLACLSRFIFVPLYLLTFYDISFFNSNWFIIVNLLLFSISCGYLSTIGMNFGCDETTNDQSLAGSIMGFHLTLGICIGSTIAEIFFS